MIKLLFIFYFIIYILFIRYELYYGNDIRNDGVAGVAYVGGACGRYRVSVQEDGDYFVTTSVTAHELGHK